MIEASELRIGNIFYTPGNTITMVTEIRFTLDRGSEFCCFGDYNNACVPIPISEEWLLRLGLDKKPWGYEFPNKWFFFIGLTDGNQWSLLVKGGIKEVDKCILQNILYVHQLQNLYFALTGKELVNNVSYQNS